MAKRSSRRRRGELGLLVMIRAVGLVMIASAFLAVTTAWSDYDLSAQRIGASIDHAIAQTEFVLSTEPLSGT